MSVTFAPVSLFILLVSVARAMLWVVVAAYCVGVLGTAAVLVMENRSPVRSLAWLPVLVLLPVIGPVLYLFFGRSMRNHAMISRRKRRKLLREEAGAVACDPRVLEAMSPEARQLSELVQSLVSSPVTPGNGVRLFSEGADKFEALKADIASARHYILMQYYIFADDALGQEIAGLLIAAVHRGVAVRVIYDHLGCMGVRKTFFDNMLRNGVDVRPFFKVTFPHMSSRANWRNHRKLCVVDGTVGYIGGMNVAGRYIDGGERFDSWRDLHLRVIGPAVAQLHYSFGVDWNFMEGEVIGEKIPPVVPLRPGNPEAAAMQAVSSGPTDEMPTMALILQKAIALARRRVYIQTPYFVPSDGVLRALQGAARANVDVRVMIPERSDSPMLTLASRSYVQECLRAGVKIYFYTAGMLHSKMMLIDGDIATVGSTNFDFRSFELNFEGNMFVYSPRFNALMNKQFLADMQHSRRIRFPQWRRRPWRARVAESLMRLFSPLL